MATGYCEHTLHGPHKHQSAVTSLQFTENFVVTSSDDGSVKLWDIKTGEFIRDLISLDSGGNGKTLLPVSSDYQCMSFFCGWVTFVGTGYQCMCSALEELLW